MLSAHDVTAIVVTYNRSAVLQQTLQALAMQTASPGHIIVVDNASSDDTAASLMHRDDVEVVQLKQNMGYGAGLAAGLDVATSPFVWLMDDDSQPRPDALSSALSVLGEQPSVALVGLGQGARLRLGIPRWAMTSSGGAVGVAEPADAVLVDCALGRTTTLQHVGLRRDLFMMFEDVDLCLRLRGAGHEIAWIPGAYVDRQHLGSQTGGTGWRGYYQSRNVLRLAIEARSVPRVAGWALRELAVVRAAPPWRVENRPKLRLRARGARDAVAGRMGWQGLPERAPVRFHDEPLARDESP